MADGRRELQQYRYLGRDKPEDAGFVDEGNFLDGHKIVYNTETGYKFQVTLQRYPSGHRVTCPELHTSNFFLTGTRWQVIADYCDSIAAMREAA